MIRRRSAVGSVALALLAIAGSSAGCATVPAPAPSPVPIPTVDRFDGVRRLVVVAAGGSKFTVASANGNGKGRTPKELDEVLKWVPYKEIVVPLAQLIFWGVSTLGESQRATASVPADVVPAFVVAGAFAQAIRGEGPFEEIVATDREPVGEARRSADAILRLAVPAWGLVAVREGPPPLAAAFADVQAHVVLRETGVVLWEHAEDVTHPERLPVAALGADRGLAREQLVAVLERAGRRLASELLYARRGGP
jgi:hypothetical protein